MSTHSECSEHSVRAERERQISLSALKPISVTIAPRSAPAQSFSATAAHRCLPVHPIFGSFRFIFPLRSRSHALAQRHIVPCSYIPATQNAWLPSCRLVHGTSLSLRVKACRVIFDQTVETELPSATALTYPQFTRVVSATSIFPRQS